MEKSSLRGKKVWITGASRGIGAAIARKLRETEATLILSSSSSDTMKKVMPEFAEYPKVFFLPFDIKSENDIKRIYQKIKASMDGVDILINNAGIGIFGSFQKMSVEDFDKMNDANYRSVFLLMKTVLDDMIEKQSGGIINILSVAIKTALPGSSLYAATKSAVLAMDASLRVEVRDKGIKIVDVFPGATATEIWDEKVREKFADRMMRAEDVAEAVSKVVELCVNDKLMVEEIVLRPQGGDL